MRKKSGVGNGEGSVGNGEGGVCNQSGSFSVAHTGNARIWYTPFIPLIYNGLSQKVYVVYDCFFLFFLFYFVFHKGAKRKETHGKND
jgi:hypothetical protein